MRLRGWIGLATLWLGSGGCSGNAEADGAMSACVPSCRSGYACVGGSCVSACNPPCAGHETCVSSGTVATCRSDDAGTAAVDATSPKSDVGPGVDATAVPDATAPSDVVAPADGSACGRPGETCCDLRYCAMGGECVATVRDGAIVGGTCRVAPAGVNECARPEDCTGAGEVCGGPVVSGAHLCFQCGRSTGTLGLLAACTSSAMCASGLCSLRQCSTPCATDAECATRSPGAVCTAVRYANTISATESVFVTRTVCVRGCARNADCPGGQVCHPVLNRVTDHLDFICQDTPAMTGPAGTPCTSGETCQSALCPAALMAGRPSVCTAPCVIDADCPAAAPRCADYLVARPSGAAQPARGCFLP
nr:hypothetical protein [Deltaproteobacteria bacterium]